MNESTQKPDDWPALIQIRTTEKVKRALKKRAQEEDRTLNWVAERMVRQALGLDENGRQGVTA